MLSPYLLRNLTTVVGFMDSFIWPAPLKEMVDLLIGRYISMLFMVDLFVMLESVVPLELNVSDVQYLATTRFSLGLELAGSLKTIL